MQTKKPFVCVGVPFYKNEDLAITTLTRLREIAEIFDASKIQLSYVFVNDSPDDLQLKAIIDKYKCNINFSVIENKENIGFLKSANKIFEHSKHLQAHCLILNSDALLSVDALSEMLTAFEHDDRARFVFPRSNNATIATIYPTDPLIPYSTENDCISFFNKCRTLLPRYTYTPTAVGFCMLIHAEVLLNNFLFDEQYGMGYEEENDLVMRVCNLGYRCIMANHAFVYHVGSVSFRSLDGSNTLSKRKLNNSELINKIHPYYAGLVNEYISSKTYIAEKYIFKMASNSKDLIFDMMNASSISNGTNKVAINILKNIVLTNSFKQIYVWTSQEVIDHLKKILPDFVSEKIIFTHDIVHLNVDVLFRPGQPFDRKQLLAARKAARVLIYYFFDTIAIDCPYLKTSSLDHVWRSMLKVNAVPIFLSNYTKTQFNNLYSTNSTHFYNNPVLLPAFSSDIEPYSICKGAKDEEADFVLVFGNVHHHKYLKQTIELLLEHTNLNITVLCELDIKNQRLKQFKSGHVSDEGLSKLISQSKLIIYPSHYEGFGLVLTEAISLGKKIVCRNLAPYKEIISSINLAAPNIFTYDTDYDFISVLKKALAHDGKVLPHNNLTTWLDCTSELLKIIDNELLKFDLQKLYDGLEAIYDTEFIYNSGYTDAGVKQSEHQVVSLIAANKQLVEDLIAIKKSRSWLVTKPLRYCIDRFRNK